MDSLSVYLIAENETMTIIGNSDGQRLQVLGDSLRMLLRSTHSPHRMSAMTVDVAPGGQVPLHRHQEEESYYLLAGELSLTIGMVEHRLRPGDFAHVLPGEVHGYHNRGEATASFLAFTVGGPIDEFFSGMSEQVHSMPEDAPAMMNLMARFGVELA